MEQDAGRGADGAPDQKTLESASSIELVRRAQGGEARAIEVLFARYQPIVRRWAAGRLPAWARDLVDTDDMTQEALMGTLRNLQGFVPRHPGAFGAYLRQSLNNRIRDEVRRAQSRPRREALSEEHSDDAASPLEVAIGKQAMERYEAALGRLDETDREMVIARIELGLGYRDIAEATGKSSPDAARMAVARALLRVAREMRDE